MNNLKSLLLTEGAHGMISQTEGLAISLQTDFNHQFVKMNNILKYFPPKILPISSITFNFDEITSNITKVNLPDYIISCGRKSVLANIYLKKFLTNKYKKKITNIHIQDPKVSANLFDFIILPEHDNDLRAQSVIRSKGALHYITETQIINSQDKNKNIDVSLILGGPNKYYSFDNQEIIQIIDEILKKFMKHNNRFRIVSSRRTPSKIIQLIKEKFKNLNNVEIDNSLDKSKYINTLANSEILVVTSDSISMISEAAITGKPIYVAYLKPSKNDYRFKRFFKSFEEMGIIKSLKNDEKVWTYKELYESKRIADIIKRKIKL